jgi:hypothetical protein
MSSGAKRVRALIAGVAVGAGGLGLARAAIKPPGNLVVDRELTYTAGFHQ